MKTVTEWFGHDVVTAIMHYHQVSNADFDKASTDNPFPLVTKKADVKSDDSTPKNGAEPTSKKCKNPWKHCSFQGL